MTNMAPSIWLAEARANLHAAVRTWTSRSVDAPTPPRPSITR